MKTQELLHAVWMLSSAIQDISSAITALERQDEPSAITWLKGAADGISQAKEAIDETNILPF